ncbi:MAG: hypothetical protein ACYCX4_02285 [Bacillota bacterium]
MSQKASITNVIEWNPPETGTVVEWETLPAVVQEVLLNGPVSPDKRWSAAIWTWHQIPTDVKLAIENGKIPLDPKFLTGPQIWISDAHRQKARPEVDSWQEITPDTGRVKPFLPEVLKGEMAGELRFSPDGSQLLYNTGIKHFTNKPSPRPQTTFLINIIGNDRKQIGVDVDISISDDGPLYWPGMFPHRPGIIA